MIPTVREVLTLPVVAPGRPTVVGGARHLDKPVRWVHSSDVTDLTGLLQALGKLLLGAL